MKNLFLTVFFCALFTIPYAYTMEQESAAQYGDHAVVLVQLRGQPYSRDNEHVSDATRFRVEENTVCSIEYCIEMPYTVAQRSTTLRNKFKEVDAKSSSIIIADTIQGVTTLSLGITLELMKKCERGSYNASLIDLVSNLRKKRYLLMLLNSAAYLGCEQSIHDIYAAALLKKLDRLVIKKDKLKKALKSSKLLAGSDRYDHIFGLTCDNFSERSDIESVVKSVQIIEGHDDAVNCVRYTADGKKLVSGSEDTTIKIWDAQNGKCLETLQNSRPVCSICLSSDNITAAAGLDNGIIAIWDIITKKWFQLKGHSYNFVSDVCFSDDGKQLASTSWDHTVKIWDMKTKNCSWALKDEDLGLSYVVNFSGGKLITVEEPLIRGISILNIKTKKRLKTFKGHKAKIKSLSYSPKRTHLASASDDRTVKIWHVQNAQCIFTLQGHTDMVASVQYSTDGKKLISGSWDNSVKIWDAETGQCHNTIHDHTDIVVSVCFSPKGDQVASCSADKTIRVYTLHSLKKDFTLSSLLLLKYLRHHKKQGNLQYLPPRRLFVKAYAHLPKFVRDQFPEPFDYNEIAEKLRD